MRYRPSHEEVLHAQRRNDQNVLKTWMKNRAIHAWDHASDSLDVAAWSRYWQQDVTLWSLEKTKRSQWSALLDLTRIHRIPEFQQWFEESIQKNLDYIFLDESVVKALQWWGDDWANRNYGNCTTPHLLNDLGRAYTNHNLRVQHYWHTRFHGRQLGEKIARAIEFLMHPDMQLHTLNKTASAIDAYMKKRSASSSPKDHYELFEALDTHMRDHEQAWKRYFVHLTYHKDEYENAYWTAKPLPNIPSNFLPQWRRYLQELKMDEIPKNINNYRLCAEFSNKYTRYLESSYMCDAIKHLRISPLQLAEHTTVFNTYNNSWIDQTLESIETFWQKNPNHSKFNYTRWADWLYAQRHNLHQWTQEQRLRAKKLSAIVSLEKTLMHRWNAEPDKDNNGFIQVLDILLSPHKAVELWKQMHTQTHASYLRHLYEHFYATPIKTWRENDVQRLLLHCIDPKHQWTEQEHILVDNMIALIANPDVIIESIVCMIQTKENSLSQSLDPP